MALRGDISAALCGVLVLGLAVGASVVHITEKQKEIPLLVRKTDDDRPLKQAIYESARGLSCGDYDLAESIAKKALSKGVPPQLLAATVSVESGCNPLAISSKGAVGLTQVHVASWKKTYDFSQINLMNPEVNLEIGASILADLLKKCNGSSRCVMLGYNNNDGQYADLVLSRAGMKK